MRSDTVVRSGPTVQISPCEAFANERMHRILGLHVGKQSSSIQSHRQQSVGCACRTIVALRALRALRALHSRRACFSISIPVLLWKKQHRRNLRRLNGRLKTSARGTLSVAVVGIPRTSPYLRVPPRAHTSAAVSSLPWMSEMVTPRWKALQRPLTA